MIDKSREELEEIMGVDKIQEEKADIELEMIHKSIYHSAFHKMSLFIMFVILFGILSVRLMEYGLMDLFK